MDLTNAPIFDEYTLQQKPTGARVFDFSHTQAQKYLPIVRRSNGTYRIDESYDADNYATGFYSHHCADCKNRPLLFVQHFDGPSKTLRFVGAVHIDDRKNAFASILPQLRQLVGFADGEDVCAYDDCHKQLVVPIDLQDSFSDNTLSHGDMIVVQQASETPKYIEAYKDLLPFPAPSTASDSALHTHIRNLWNNRQNADVIIRFGPSAALSLKCHSLILSMSPYFNNVFNNKSFARVSETTLDSIHDPTAIETIIEYMYLGNSLTLTTGTVNLKIAMIKVADFLNLDDLVKILVDSINMRSLRRTLVHSVLRLGLDCAAARNLVVVASDWIFANIEVLREDGPLKEFLRENEGAYNVVMEGVGTRVTSLKRKRDEE